MSIDNVGIRPARTVGWSAFDGDGVATGIRRHNYITISVGFKDIDGYGGGNGGVYDNVWNAAVAGRRPEDRMQRIGRATIVPLGGDGRRIRIDGGVRDVGVPGIGRWKRNKSIQISAGAVGCRSTKRDSGAGLGVNATAEKNKKTEKAQRAQWQAGLH